MNEVNFILLSALFLSVPLGIKYWIAFQTRHLLDDLKAREKEVALLVAQADALDSQKMVMRRAVNQVQSLGRQATARRDLLNDRIAQMRHRTQPSVARHPVIQADEIMPQLDAESAEA